MSGADKLGYLIRALSRTKRKDYENYVVNAIWNRLAMGDVKPVTQQLVLWPDGRRSFVDLYFPQAMIGGGNAMRPIIRGNGNVTASAR